MAIGQSQPFGKSDGCVFGDTIRCGTGLVQQTRSRCGDQDVAVAARQHARHQMPRRPDLGHHIGFPGPVPVFVRGFRAAQRQDARIGTEQINRCDVIFDMGNQCLNVAFPGNVAFERMSAQMPRQILRALDIDIGTDDPRALFCETFGQTFSDTRCSTGNDNRLSIEVHRARSLAAFKDQRNTWKTRRQPVFTCIC